jgi:hypothetical protein
MDVLLSLPIAPIYAVFRGRRKWNFKLQCRNMKQLRCGVHWPFRGLV